MKSKVLYAVKIERSKPQLSIFRPLAGSSHEQLIALATFRRLSSIVDVQMRDGRQLKMHHKSFRFGIHTFKAVGSIWSWRRDGLITNNLRLVDEESNGTIAILTEEFSWSGRKFGTITIFGNYRSSTIDAIVVTGLAKLGHQRLARKLLAAATSSR